MNEITIRFHKSIRKFTNGYSEFTVPRDSYLGIINYCLSMFPDLKRYFRKIAANPNTLKEELFLLVNKEILPNNKLVFTPKKDAELFLCPAIFGYGKGVTSALLIIAGIVLIVVGVVFEQYYLIGPGLSLITGGITTALTPEPSKLKTGDSKARRDNYAFEGLVNSTDQSNPIALHYGHVRVAGQLLSGSLYTIDESNPYTPSKGELVKTILEGKG